MKHIQKRLYLKNIRSCCFGLGGVVSGSILDIAETEAVDLIVMSTHGRSGLSRWVYGNAAPKILQVASFPVFSVRAINAQADRSPDDA